MIKSKIAKKYSTIAFFLLFFTKFLIPVPKAAQTDIGLTGGGEGSNLFYLSGVPHHKVASSEIIEKVVELIKK